MKLALIGDPVEHSRSPLLHRDFLEEAEIDGSYVGDWGFGWSGR